MLGSRSDVGKNASVATHVFAQYSPLVLKRSNGKSVKNHENLWQMEVLRGTSFGNGNCRHIAGEHEPETGQDLLGHNFSWWTAVWTSRFGVRIPIFIQVACHLMETNQRWIGAPFFKPFNWSNQPQMFDHFTSNFYCCYKCTHNFLACLSTWYFLHGLPHPILDA